jgi:hypothetical protein
MVNRTYLTGVTILSVLTLVMGVALASPTNGAPKATLAAMHRAPAAQSATPKSPEGQPAAKGVLDGKFFKGEMGQEGQAAGKPCGLMFRNGMFHVHGEKGESPMVAAYTATEANGTVTFTAMLTDAKEGKMEWQGTVTGDDLQATVMATKEGQAPQKMWVKAKKAEMPEHHKGAMNEMKGKGPQAAPPPAGK